MKKKPDCVRRAAALLLALLLCGQLAVPVRAEREDETVLYLSSVEDLLAFSRNCSLDTWSQGKTVVLTTDLSLAGIDFAPIPTFGGTFDGGGHAITGLSLSGKYAPAGLFGVLQSTAVVKDLRASGIVEPDGTGEPVGGIAGENHGRIEHCSFSGVVTGKSSVGGIVGRNSLSGTVQGCTVSGTVLGTSMTGGIAGKNLGTLSGCENRAAVNRSSLDPGLDLSDLELDPGTELLTLRTLDTVNIATDTGGIAGHSSGMVLSCQNTGEVGYAHTGYNVGGIVGRNCGHLFGCTNDGPVWGRKDVGGIAGQAEPYIVLDLSADLLGDIRGQLDRLQGLVDGAADNTSGSGSTLSDQLSALGTSLDSVMDHAETLTDLLSDYGDSAITEIDRGSELLWDTIDRLSGLSDKADALSASLSGTLDTLQDAMEELADASQDGTDALRELRAAVDAVKTAREELSRGIQRIQTGLKQLAQALLQGDRDAARKALGVIESGVEDLVSASGELHTALGQLAAALKEFGPDSEEAAAAVQELADAQDQMTAALRTVLQGVRGLGESAAPNPETLKSGLQEITGGLKLIQGLPARFKQAVEHLRNAAAHTESAGTHLTAALNRLASALGTFGDSSDDWKDLLDEVEDLLDHLADSDAIQIAHPSEEIGDSADAIFRTMEQISTQMSALNTQANDSLGQLRDDIRAISAQLHTTMNTLLDAVAEAENGSGDLFSDTSEENIEAVTSGKLLSCVNHGTISGDINVGGVAGSMAVEYELDPEDDLLSDDTAIYRREYELKAILQKCVNTGTVTSRRNYAGGICGRMGLGLITACEGYGTVESEQADYAGGIAGYATGTVRDCFAKCRLSGRNYIGGITGNAGSSAKVLRCYSFVEADASGQYTGAVSGSQEGLFQSNYFVSDTLAGLDRISISGAAEPMEYAALLQVEALPDAFRTLTLRFWIDGQIVREEPFSYGDSFGTEIFPALPAQDGVFGVWDRDTLTDLHFDTDVTAVYAPYRTTLGSEARREDGRPVFLTEGQFEQSGAFAAEPLELSDAGADKLSGLSPLSLRTALEAWTLRGMDDGQLTHTVRYLAPDGSPAHVELYEKQDGVWKKLDTEVSGSYLLAQVSGSSAEIAAVTCTPIGWVWLLAALLAVLVIGGRTLIRHRRRSRAQPAPQDIALP